MRGEKARRYRRRFPIHAYVGSNGSGKSLAAVWDSMPTLESGRAVLSTVRLTEWDPGRPCTDEACESWRHPTHGAAHPLWVPLTGWDQVLEAEHCDVIMDEVAGIASARASMALPGAIEVLLQQLRRRDVILRWTAPAWNRADTIIREVTQAVTVCTGYLRAPVSEQGDMWRPRRVFRWRTYDPTDLADDGDVRKDARKLFACWFKGPGSDAFRAYDSLDDVTLVGTVTDSGRCVVCGGRRRVPECHCDDRKRPSIVRSVITAGETQEPTGQGGPLPMLIPDRGGNGRHESTG